MYHSQTSKEVRIPKDASGSTASRNAPDTDHKQVYSPHNSTNPIPSNADHGKISTNSEKFQREFRDEMIIKILTETQWILWRTSVGSKLKNLYPTTDSELLLSNDDIFRKKLRKAFRDTVNRSRCCEATGNLLCFANSSAVHHLLDQLSNLYCTDFRDTTTGHCTNNADSDMIIDVSINPQNISLNTDSLKLKLYEMPFNQEEKNNPIIMPDPTEEWLTDMLQENTSDNKGVTSVNEDDGKLIIDETPPERPKRKRKPRKLLLEELAMTDDEGEEEEEEEEGKKKTKNKKEKKNQRT